MQDKNLIGSQERGANSTWYEPNVAPEATLKEHTCRHRHLSTNTHTHAHTHTPNPKASSPPHVLTCANYIPKKAKRDSERAQTSNVLVWSRIRPLAATAEPRGGGKHQLSLRCKAGGRNVYGVFCEGCERAVMEEVFRSPFYPALKMLLQVAVQLEMWFSSCSHGWMFQRLCVEPYICGITGVNGVHIKSENVPKR